MIRRLIAAARAVLSTSTPADPYIVVALMGLAGTVLNRYAAAMSEAADGLRTQIDGLLAQRDATMVLAQDALNQRVDAEDALAESRRRAEYDQAEQQPAETD